MGFNSAFEGLISKAPRRDGVWRSGKVLCLGNMKHPIFGGPVSTVLITGLYGIKYRPK